MVQTNQMLDKTQWIACFLKLAHFEDEVKLVNQWCVTQASCTCSLQNSPFVEQMSSLPQTKAAQLLLPMEQTSNWWNTDEWFYNCHYQVTIHYLLVVLFVQHNTGGSSGFMVLISIGLTFIHFHNENSSFSTVHLPPFLVCNFWGGAGCHDEVQ